MNILKGADMSDNAKMDYLKLNEFKCGISDAILFGRPKIVSSNLLSDNSTSSPYYRGGYKFGKSMRSDILDLFNKINEGDNDDG